MMDRVEVHTYTEIYKDYYNNQEIYTQTEEVKTIDYNEENQPQQEQQQSTGNEIVDTFKGSYVNVTI